MIKLKMIIESAFMRRKAEEPISEQTILKKTSFRAI